MQDEDDLDAKSEGNEVDDADENDDEEEERPPRQRKQDARPAKKAKPSHAEGAKLGKKARREPKSPAVVETSSDDEESIVRQVSVFFIAFDWILTIPLGKAVHQASPRAEVARCGTRQLGRGGGRQAHCEKGKPIFLAFQTFILTNVPVREEPKGQGQGS